MTNCLKLVCSVALLSILAGTASAQRGTEGEATPFVLTSGFEDYEAGPFTELTQAGMTWHAAEGHAVIHTQHQRSGRQSLRLMGGANRRVELTFGNNTSSDASVSFWARRWTQTNPFEFRVYGRVDGRWRELYNGDKQVQTRGFNVHVRVGLPGGTDALRFESTTPEGSGVLIDDLRIGKAVPMQIESVDTLQPVSPALVGNRTNAVALIAVETIGGVEPITLEQIQINTEGTTDLGDIEAVEVYYTGSNRVLGHDVPDANFPEDARFGRAQRPSGELTFRGQQPLQEGINYFWVSYTLKNTADIDGRVDAGCEWIKLAGDSEQIVPETVNPEVCQRMGVVMRAANMDGIRVYRIPGVVTTNKGTLIAVYDNRKRGWNDLPADIDVGMSRSTDGGRTWEPMKVIMDMGNDPAFNSEGIGDPAVLVDSTTNTVYVAALWSHGNRGWHGSGPGLSPEETGQFMLVRSRDDGKTWSRPVNITEQVKDPSWRLLLQGPGKGITMADGTLVFPAQFRDDKGVPHSTIIFSKDSGEHWEIGTGAWPNTTESQVVELEPGKLMLNCRYDRQDRRVVMITTDMGQTWTEHPTTRSALTDPGSCMSSLINVDRELGRPYNGLLLFSNPAGARARELMTIRASTDGGMSWPEAQSLLIDHGRSAGYSCMTMIDQEYVGIVYEGNRAHMTFQRIKLADLIGETRE